MSIIEQMFLKYEIKTQNDIINAIKEIFQEIVLLGLYNGGFFKKAAFYGGTALRILYGLDRFSEDLDFTLLKKESKFNIEDYFSFIAEEFEALGIEVELKKKIKTNNLTDIESAFLKNNTQIHDLNISLDSIKNILGNIHNKKVLKIKIEVDTNPPSKFQTEIKTLLMPRTFNIISMTKDNLFAGKMHAVLCRNWKNRVKGRDWYDFEWYVKQQIPLNMEHLQERLYESKDLDRNTPLTKKLLKNMLLRKIDTLDIAKAKEEVSVFIKNKSSLEFWSKEYFILLADRIKIFQKLS
jgi:predicted nucleotidyltransferase component of viral defense system